MGRLLRRLRYWIRQGREDAALREELEFHHAMTRDELEARGLSPDAAGAAARRALGNVTRAREDARAVWVWSSLESVCQDAGFAVRILRRQPGFACLSVLVLGVTIGLNTSLFTVFAGLVLRPRPGVPEPDRVVTLAEMSYPEYRALAEQTRTLSGLAAERSVDVTLEAGGVARTTVAHLVTGNYFGVLGARMGLGRGLEADDDRPGSASRVVVVSHDLWERRLNADPAAVGSVVRINDIPHIVVGVTAAAFIASDGGSQRVWLPITSVRAVSPHDLSVSTLLTSAADCCVDVVGRLTGDAGRRQAGAELQLLSDRFRAGLSQPSRPIDVAGTQFIRGRRAAGTALAIIGLLFLGMLLLLLLACANLGNVFLARAAARGGELAVRLSIGAGRTRVIRQLLTEGFVLALLGSLVGVAVAAWLPGVALSILAGQRAPFDVRTDLAVLMYALLLAAITCIACALAPALHATRADLAATLKASVDAAIGRVRLRGLLLGIQVAVTVVLLTSAGLLLRGVLEARAVDPGIAVNDVGVATIELPRGEYDPVLAASFLAELRTALDGGAPDRVAFVTTEPLADRSFWTGVRLPGQAGHESREIEWFGISPGYFQVLGVPVVAGRDLTAADAARDVVMVNESFARMFWPGQPAIGQTFVAGGGDQPRVLEVAGVAKDAHVDTLDAVAPLLFTPLTDPGPIRFPKALFRTGASSPAATIAGTVQRLAPRARVTIVPLRERVDRWLAELAMAPVAASILGAFGLGLATVGLSGVFAFAVRQRRREIGVRLALGASSRDIIRLVLAGHSQPLAWGMAVGLAAAAGASQVLRGALYGLSPLDPVTYGSVAALLAGSAALASYLPARRAARIDPTEALRE